MEYSVMGNKYEESSGPTKIPPILFRPNVKNNSKSSKDKLFKEALAQVIKRYGKLLEKLAKE